MFKVHNGNGEVVFTANTRQEAESFLTEHFAEKLKNEGNVQDRAEDSVQARAGGIVAKVVKKLGPAGKIITVTCIAYRIGDYLLGDGTIEDIIGEIIQIDTLRELAKDMKEILIHTYTNYPINPYPPHSYQGAMWTRQNFWWIAEL